LKFNIIEIYIQNHSWFERKCGNWTMASTTQ